MHRFLCLMLALACADPAKTPSEPDGETGGDTGPVSPGPDAEGAVNASGMIYRDGDERVFEPCNADGAVPILTWPDEMWEAYDIVAADGQPSYANVQVAQRDEGVHMVDWHRLLPLASCDNVMGIAGLWEAVGEDPQWSVVVREDTVRLDMLQMDPAPTPVSAEYDLVEAGFDDATQREVFRFDADGVDTVLSLERAMCLYRTNAYSRTATLEDGETRLGCGRPLQ